MVFQATIRTITACGICFLSQEKPASCCISKAGSNEEMFENVKITKLKNGACVATSELKEANV